MLRFFPILLASWLALSLKVALSVKVDQYLPESTVTSSTATSSTATASTCPTARAPTIPIGESLYLVIPTASNNTQAQQIDDTYEIGNCAKIYSIHVGIDYPQLDTPGVTDVYHGYQPDFSVYLRDCAIMDAGNEGNVTYFTGCTGVSWVYNQCFLKLGLHTESLVPSYNYDAI